MCNNCNESNAVRQEARQEQQALEDMRRQAKEEEHDERRRLEEEVAKHKVHHGKGEAPQGECCHSSCRRQVQRLIKGR